MTLQEAFERLEHDQKYYQRALATKAKGEGDYELKWAIYYLSHSQEVVDMLTGYGPERPLHHTYYPDTGIRKSWRGV